ncbi:MAG: hypothetical protein GKR88_14260 [Flavobacteriaceae bacterium]|nr:MAG: hypothetical protein GKR88_14260 [Flavobacteriaceae bacterium]
MKNIFSNIKERVVEIAEKQSITKEEFFSSIGMTSANFRGKAKNSPLNSNAIVNIVTKYPDTDLHWLLFGDSNLAEEEPLKQYKSPNKASDDKDKLIEVLLEQITELKSDKEILKKLLGLHNE